jgi:hypothetical protein
MNVRFEYCSVIGKCFTVFSSSRFWKFSQVSLWKLCGFYFASYTSLLHNYLIINIRHKKLPVHSTTLKILPCEKMTRSVAVVIVLSVLYCGCYANNGTETTKECYLSGK